MLAIRDYGMSVLLTTTLVDDVVVFSILIAIVPVALMDFREDRRIRKLEEALPNFFRDLAGMNDGGMTLPNAIHLVAQGEYSTLTPFIRRLDNEMSWNTTFIGALERFWSPSDACGQEHRSHRQGQQAGGRERSSPCGCKGHVKVLALRTERRNNMLIYVIVIITISFFVFVFVIFVLVTCF